VIFNRRFSARRVRRWLAGAMPLGDLLRLKDRDREHLSRQAYRRLEAEEFEAAERLFDLLSRLWPELEATARLGLGVCAQRRGNLADAELAYDQVIALEPDNVYALANRAEVRLLTNRRAEAQADLGGARAALGRQKFPEALRQRVSKLHEIAIDGGLEPAAGIRET
jgi:Flp pilus assembly protein TadD